MKWDVYVTSSEHLPVGLLGPYCCCLTEEPLIGQRFYSWASLCAPFSASHGPALALLPDSIDMHTMGCLEAEEPETQPDVIQRFSALSLPKPPT